MIREIQSKSALHYHARKFATHWDVNIYRGCGHGCVYCFARYSHRYFDDADFFADIYVKTNIAENLDRELAAVVQVDVIVSVSALDEKVRAITEPCSAPTADRLNMLSAFREAGCRTGVLIMPVIPFLTDTEDNLRGIYELAAKNKVNFVLPETLHLRGSTREPFLQMVQTKFPESYLKISSLYPGSHAGDPYLRSFRALIRQLQNEYRPWAKYTPPLPVPAIGTGTQLSLF